MAYGPLDLLDVLNEMFGTHFAWANDLSRESQFFADALRRRYLGRTRSPESNAGDDHIRCIKATLKAKGPVGVNLTAPDPAAAERTRILAAIKELKPPHRVKANGDWARAWKEAGELAMWERVIAAIGGE
jgi:hypothetical protein